MNEISCKITSSFVQYVRNTKPGLLMPLLEGLPYDEAFLSDPDNWIPWDTERVLEERLQYLYNDESIMFEIGRCAVTFKYLGMVSIALNLFMTPELLIRYAPKVARYLTKDVVRIDVIEARSGSAVVELRIKGKQTRGACLFNQGLFSGITVLFGLPPATVSEVQCVVTPEFLGCNPPTFGQTVFGAPSCIFRLQWQEMKRSFFGRKPGKEKALHDALLHLEENHAKLERAYERIYKSEERYRNLMESASDIICFLDIAGNILSLNKKGLDVTGYSLDEIRGRNFLDFVVESCRDASEEHFTKSLMGPVPVFEFAIRKKDGGHLMISANNTTINENGKVVGIMSIARDITAEKEMALRLLEAERFAAKGLVAAEIAHEINNSLANIETALFILKNIKIERRYRRDVLNDVNEEVERMSGIVKGILDVYRADNAVLQSVDINSEILKVISIAQRRLQGKGILMVPDLAQGLPPIPCYPGHIKQILLNLVKNAEEAMDLSQSNSIEIKTGEEGDYIRIDVIDSGCGIPVDRLELVCSPLYTSKSEGTGLGLSVCKEIAAKYGGDIEVSSIQGRGTGVTVLLRKG